MSKIIIDARELRTSTGRYIERLLHYLQLIDKDNAYVVLLKPQDMPGWLPTAPNFKTVACPHKEFTFDEQLGFKQQLASLHPDLVHFGTTQQPILYRGPVVTTIHDLTTARFTNPDKNLAVFKLKQQVYKQVIVRAARKSEVVLVPSEFVKRDLVAFAKIPPEKVTVTYEAADRITEPAMAITALQKQKFIMYVGRPTPHKNLPRLIEAFSLLRSTRPELKLVLAGKKDANYEHIEASLDKALRPHVYFTGFISEGSLRWLYEHTQAYIFPSLSEGFGLPGIEAMVHGAPVVSSKATCLPEIYGDAAYYFEPANVEDMRIAIDKVLGDKQLRQQLIAAGTARAASFSWQRMAEQTLAVYNRALAT